MTDQNGTSQQDHARPSTDEPTARGAARTPVFDAVAAAVRKGAEHARKEAEEAIPRLKSAASDAAYWTAYGVAFAAVFNWTLIKNLTPERVKVGGRDGVRAGRTAAEDWVEHMKRRNEPRTTPLLMQPVSSGTEGTQGSGV